MSNWSTKHDDAVHGVSITSKQADRIIHAARARNLDSVKALEIARFVTSKNELRCLMDLTADEAKKVIAHIRDQGC